MVAKLNARATMMNGRVVRGEVVDWNGPETVRASSAP
jgi:hypothetical protein